jgi:hypothetical protein
MSSDVSLGRQGKAVGFAPTGPAALLFGRRIDIDRHEIAKHRRQKRQGDALPSKIQQAIKQERALRKEAKGG